MKVHAFQYLARIACYWPSPLLRCRYALTCFSLNPFAKKGYLLSHSSIGLIARHRPADSIVRNRLLLFTPAPQLWLCLKRIYVCGTGPGSSKDG